MIKTKNTPVTFELLVTDLFGQIRTDIASVTVRVFHRESGTEVDDLSATAMSGSSGNYYYKHSSGFSVGEYVVEYHIVDTVAEDYYERENLTVGYLEDDIQLIKNIESGNWRIESNQMIFADLNGVELFRCNLFDSENKPSMSEVFKRVRV